MKTFNQQEIDVTFMWKPWKNKKTNKQKQTLSKSNKQIKKEHKIYTAYATEVWFIKNISYKIIFAYLHVHQQNY